MGQKGPMMAQEFSIAGFIAHMVDKFGGLVVAEDIALHKSAQIVLDEAKSIPGEYQSGAGPFASWAPLAASTLADKARKGYPSPSPELRTGELRDSYEMTVNFPKAHVGSNSDIAVWQEMGTSKMPPRSIVGLAAVRKEKDVHQIIGKTVLAALTGESIPGIVGAIAKKL